MSRAVVAGVLGVSLALCACSGAGGSAAPSVDSSACGRLAQLRSVGQTVARADVSDPAKFEATLRAAVTTYVRTAKALRSAVPARLRPDVDSMIRAVQQRRFSEADRARSHLERFQNSVCKT